MLRTYRAILNGDRVEWRGEEPDATGALEVRITVLESTTLNQNGQRREQRIAALRQLAERGTLSELTDADDWQRQQRRDRPLAGRNS